MFAIEHGRTVVSVGTYIVAVDVDDLVQEPAEATLGSALQPCRITRDGEGVSWLAIGGDQVEQCDNGSEASVHLYWDYDRCGGDFSVRIFRVFGP